jgi:flagellar biosynthetic protein FliR
VSPQTIDLPHLADVQIAGFVLVLARVGALFTLAPVFSSRMLPVRAKVIAAGAISLALTPLATRGHHVPVEPVALGELVLKEMVVGTAFAFSIAALAAAVQAGATLLDTLIGFSFASVLDPITNQQNAILGQLYAIFTAAIFVVTGGAEMMVMGLARSYTIVPIDAYPGASTLAGLASHVFSQVFMVALEVAAPPLIALVVCDAAFGIVARAVPQMNVFVIGLPAKILLGVATIAASLPFLSGHLGDAMQRAVSDGLRGLGGG